MWSPFRGGRHATRTVPKRRGVFAILVAIPGLVGFGAASANATGGYGHKVTLCHATASNSNPYVTVTVDKNSIKYQGHLAHVNGKVWPTPEWGDIIPAPESGCPGSELKKATAVNGTPVDSCGPTMNADINPATTEGVDYIKTVSGNTVTLTAKAKAGYELTNPTWSQSYTDKLVACPVEPSIARDSLTCKTVTWTVSNFDQDGAGVIIEPQLPMTVTPPATFSFDLSKLAAGTQVTFTFRWKEGDVRKFKSDTVTVPACPVELKKATAVNGTPVDSCGPTMNADINPATTEGVDYIKTVSGNTVTLTAKAKAGYELTNPTWSQSYTDKLVACPVELKKATAVNGTPVDSCGPTMNADINPATTEGVDYIKTVSGNTVTLTAKAKAGYELTNPTWSQSYTDKLVACPVEKPNPKPTKPGRSGGSGLGPDRDDTGFPVGLLGGFAFAGGMVLLAGRRRREAPNA